MVSYFDALSLFVEKNPLYQPTEKHTLCYEQLLENVLTKEDLIALNLPLFLRPKILRGLPRLVHPLDSSRYKIPDAFSDLALLKKQILDKALLYLYYTHYVPKQGSLLLLTFAFADGRGDLMTHQHIHDYLRKVFPRLEISSQLLIHHDFPWKKEKNTLLYGKNHIHEAFTQEHLSLFKNANLILETPTAFPHYQELKTLAPHTSLERLGEHGLIEAAAFQPAVSRCMGLHFLEKGLFVKEKILRDFSKIQNPFLSRFLGQNRFNFGYTKTVRGTSLYVMTLLYATARAKEDLDICLFQFPSKIAFENAPYFQGVREVLIYTEKTVTRIPLHPQGKRIRFFLCDHLFHQDVLQLTALSQDLVGCTGDQSVLEAISTGTPFFYDPPPFKRRFLKDLSLVAEHARLKTAHKFLALCLKNPELFLSEPQGGFVSEDVLECMEERSSLEDNSDITIAQTLGNLLCDPSCQKDFLELQEYLKTEYPLEPILQGIIARAFCHQEHKEIALLENQLIERFLKGEISGRELLFELRCALL